MSFWDIMILLDHLLKASMFVNVTIYIDFFVNQSNDIFSAWMNLVHILLNMIFDIQIVKTTGRRFIG